MIEENFKKWDEEKRIENLKKAAVAEEIRKNNEEIALFNELKNEEMRLQREGKFNTDDEHPVRNPGFLYKYLKTATLNPFRDPEEEKRREKEKIDERKRQFGTLYLLTPNKELHLNN